MRPLRTLLILSVCAGCGAPEAVPDPGPRDVIPEHDASGDTGALAGKLLARARELQQRDVKSAWRNLEASLDVDAANAEALDLRGVLAWARGKPEQMRASWAKPEGTGTHAVWARLHRAMAARLSALPDTDLAADLAWLAEHSNGTAAAPLAGALQAAVAGDWESMNDQLNAASSGWETWALRAHYEESRPNGDLDAAASAWDEALAVAPAIGCLLAGRARAKDRREPGSGRADWDAVIRSENWVAGHRAARGLSRLRAGDLTGAQTDLDWAIRLDPSDLDSYRARGVLWRARNDLPRALEDMEQVLKLAPADRTARIARAELLAKLGRLDDALGAWNALIAENADDVEAIAGRGKVRAAQGDAAGAREDILRALELDPEDPAARLVRAGFRAAEEDWAGALNDLNFAVHAGAGGADAYRRRARVKLQLDDRTGARADIDRALYEGAVSAWLYFTRARMLLDDGDLEGAAADLDRAVSIEPRNADAHVARGELAHARGKFEEALASYDRAVQLEPKNKVLRAQRGFVRADAGNRRAAIADLEFASGDDNAASIKDRDMRIKIRTRLAEIRVEEARGGR